MLRIFELHGRRVKCETRQVDVDCWELRITDSDGRVRIQYFADPRLLDKEATGAQREWTDSGWQLQSFNEWIPVNAEFAK